MDYSRSTNVEIKNTFSQKNVCAIAIQPVLSTVQHMDETIEEVSNSNPKRQNGKPVLFEQR